MQKSQTSHFDTQLGRIVRHDLRNTSSKGTKMNDLSENGEVSAKKKTREVGGKVAMAFINEKGDKAKHPAEGTRAVYAELVLTKEQELLDLTQMRNEDGSPADILYRLAAFGASVLGRNEVNTTPADDGAEGMAENLRGRWEGFRQGLYRSVSTGSATPVILLALERALTAMGLDESAVETKVAAWRAKYDAGEDEDAQKKSHASVIKDLRAVAEVRAAEKAIRQEREDARLAAAPQKSLADL